MSKSNDILRIDGADGEGGGQVLRTALAMSIVTGRPIHIDNIRARRKKPGLMRQHLTCVRAAERIGLATVSDVGVGATSLSFSPQGNVAGEYRFSIGTAGSTTLVLQCVLPALLVAKGSSRIVLEGGTHNPMSPPFDFLRHAYLPLLARMGAKVHAELERPGFFPAGGGRIVIDIEGGRPLSPLRLSSPTSERRVRAVARVANLPEKIGHREMRTVKEKLELCRDDVRVEMMKGSTGPGNVVQVLVEHDASDASPGAPVVNVFTAFGEQRKRAEEVARAVAKRARKFIAANVACDEHLCDQLLIPLALAGGGEFSTVAQAAHTSLHAKTNAALIERFLPVSISFDDEEDTGRGVCRVAPR